MVAKILLVERTLDPFQFIVPLFLIVICGVTIGLSVMFYNDNASYQNKPITTLNPSIDQKLIDYCSKKDVYIENLYIVFTVFFAIGIIGVFLYIYNFVTSICVSS